MPCLGLNTSCNLGSWSDARFGKLPDVIEAEARGGTGMRASCDGDAMRGSFNPLTCTSRKRSTCTEAGQPSFFIPLAPRVRSLHPAPMKPTAPTAAELTILRVLWRKGPSTVRDVHEEVYAETGTGY